MGIGDCGAEKGMGMPMPKVSWATKCGMGGGLMGHLLKLVMKFK